jgi:hypothetical protein
MTADIQRRLSRDFAKTSGEIERALEVLALRGESDPDINAARLREFILSDRYTIRVENKAWKIKMMFQLMLDFMPIIDRMSWRWLVSDEQAFVTSDHPVTIFDPAGKDPLAGGFLQPQAELSFPLSSHLC